MGPSCYTLLIAIYLVTLTIGTTKTTDPCVEYEPLNILTHESEDYYKTQNGYSRQHFSQALQDCELRKHECVRLQIVHGQVLIVQPIYVAYKSRTLSTAMMIQTLVDRSADIPNVDLVLYTGDYHHSEFHYWTYSRPLGVHHGWILPEYSLYAWPEAGLQTWMQSASILNRIAATSNYTAKNETLFWRGSNLIDLRDQLLAKVPDFQPQAWFDISALSQGGAPNNTTTGYVSLYKQCSKYKYLLYVEGYAQSGRFKYQLSCNSLLISHPVQYLEYWTPLLVPGVHYVVLPSNDWTNLPKLMNLVHLADRAHFPDPGIRISPSEMVNNALNLSRYAFSQKAMGCQLRAALVAYRRSITWDQFGTVSNATWANVSPHPDAIPVGALVRRVLGQWMGFSGGRLRTGIP